MRRTTMNHGHLSWIHSDFLLLVNARLTHTHIIQQIADKIKKTNNNEIGASTKKIEVQNKVRAVAENKREREREGSSTRGNVEESE